jgi:FtsP/CotA-like multicopper oxidase with cupredoxin domain
MYQFTPREAGFYFYHCHRNTPLHFEMGLFGGLIVDPPQGPGFVRAYNPSGGHVVRYDTEVVWVCSAHDHRWHELSHNHALGDLDPNDPDAFPRDGILDDWRPTVFTISGAVARDGNTVITDRRAMGRARVGQTVLVRLLNASYAIQEYRIGADVLVVAQDGRPFGVPPFGSYSAPYVIPAGTPFRLTSAMRFDVLIRPTAPGSIPFQVDNRDWQDRVLRGRARTQIVVQ